MHIFSSCVPMILRFTHTHTHTHKTTYPHSLNQTDTSVSVKKIVCAASTSVLLHAVNNVKYVCRARRFIYSFSQTHRLWEEANG